ncbi:MAG: hypothetical protein U9P79_09820 [Candidatus Cloacimonadota bacterium]|nr:hypothetical protein [Candidatus Cloacimonadota bacterium]
MSAKKSVKIFFSTHGGESSVPPKSVEDSQFLYFTYEPSGDWEFKEDDTKEGLYSIAITQKLASISPSSIVPHLNMEKISFVVAAFPKKSMEIFTTFRFTNQLGSSANISIPEKYWTGYLEYKKFYEDGATYLDEKKYLLAFNELKHFITDSELIKHFTSYQVAKPLLKKSVDSYTNNFKSDFEFMQLEIKKNQTTNTAQITQVDSILTGLKIGLQTFEPYFDAQDESKIKDDLLLLITKVQTALDNLKEKYMEQFSFEDYNSYKFNLFIDLTARLICHTDKIINIEKMDSLNLQILNENSEDKYFSEKAMELNELGWTKDFQLFVYLINNNIQNSQMVFSQNIMDNLGSLQDKEKQPYYDLFTGFNNLFQKKYPSFDENIKLAIRKCTDVNFLSDLGTLLISLKISQSNISEEILSSFNRGLELEKKRDLGKAQHIFDIITKKTNSFAPPYFYLGKIYYLNGQYATSDILFNKSLKIDPEYIAPWRYKIKLYLDNKNFGTAQTEINKALEDNKIWYFYYLKSLILFFLDEYDQAEDVALNKCLTLNQYSFDLRILLGDIYREKGDLDSAENQFKIAGEIDMQNVKFNDKLQEINDLRNK